MDEVKLEGYLILAIYPAQRRWYGKKKSKVVIESAVPLPTGRTELRNTLLIGWIIPQPTFFEHRIPATILEQ